jgi:hypothetical protein
MLPTNRPAPVDDRSQSSPKHFAKKYEDGPKHNETALPLDSARLDSYFLSSSLLSSPRTSALDVLPLPPLPLALDPLELWMTFLLRGVGCRFDWAL